jgi:hypothetical protein
MRSKILNLLVLAVLGGGQLSAQASLLNPLEYDDGTRTWLQLSETVGLSINDIYSGAGGWNTRYRFATDAEVVGLVNSFGLVTTDYAINPGGGPSAFVYGIGGTTQGGYAGTWFSNGDAGAIGRGLNAHILAGFTSGDAGYALSPNCPAYFSCSYASVDYGAQSYTDRNGWTGNFLVKLDAPVDVPEPSTLALLALSGALLLIAKRVRQA